MNVMSRTISPTLLRNVCKYLRTKNTISARSFQPKLYISKVSKILLGSQICCAALKSEERTKIDIEDGLRQACEEGDSAIILLMDRLKDFVIAVSREYRICLTKQIEITEAASNIGPLSEIWDDLPEYRTLADELSKELNEYLTVFNAIGLMMREESLVTFVKGANNQLDLVAVKYKELDVLLQKEFALNKETELKLLQMKRDSILKG